MLHDARSSSTHGNGRSSAGEIARDGSGGFNYVCIASWRIIHGVFGVFLGKWDYSSVSTPAVLALLLVSCASYCCAIDNTRFRVAVSFPKVEVKLS